MYANAQRGLGFHAPRRGSASLGARRATCVKRRDDPQHSGHPVVPSARLCSGIQGPRQQRGDRDLWNMEVRFESRKTHPLRRSSREIPRLDQAHREAAGLRPGRMSGAKGGRGWCVVWTIRYQRYPRASGGHLKPRTFLAFGWLDASSTQRPAAFAGMTVWAIRDATGRVVHCALRRGTLHSAP
jgi:hypothetical protein